LGGLEKGTGERRMHQQRPPRMIRPEALRPVDQLLTHRSIAGAIGRLSTSFSASRSQARATNPQISPTS
jgi:hypothetical protein